MVNSHDGGDKMVRNWPLRAHIGGLASAFVAFTVIAACAGSTSGTASAQNGGDEPCTTPGTPAGTNAAVAQSCNYAGLNPSLAPELKAIAFYHAAKAFLADGNAVEAAKSIDQSYAQISDEGLVARTPEGEGRSRRKRAEDYTKKKKQYIALAVDRTLVSESALSTIAGQYAANGFGPAGAPCASADDCLSKALDRRRKLSPVITTNANLLAQGQYQSYFNGLAQRYAERYEQTNIPTDAIEALNAYKALAAVDPQAKSTLYAYALKVANDAAAKARDEPENASRAIRYYSEARDAFPTAAAPNIGIGAMNNLLASVAQSSGSAASSPYYREAILSFDKVLDDPAARQRASDLEKAEAWVGRGTAKFALGDQDGGTADYRQASALPASFKVYSTLGEVFWSNATKSGSVRRGDEDRQALQLLQQAHENYQKAHGLAQTADLSAAALSQMYYHFADTRIRLGSYSPEQIVELLNIALARDPAFADALIDRATYGMKTANPDVTRVRADLLAIAGRDTNSSELLGRANAALATTYVTSGTPDWKKALEYSQAATAKDGSSFQNRMQACVSRLMAGDKVHRGYVYGYRVVEGNRRDYAPDTCTNGNTAKDLMLQGMYIMAKTGGTDSRSESDQIRAGQTNLMNQALARPEVTADDRANFGWPPFADGPPAKTKAVLVLIREASLACTTRGPISKPTGLGLTPQDYADAENFLKFYGAFKC